MEENKRMINLKLGKWLFMGMRRREEGILQIFSNIQFFNLKGILLFFWEFYIGIECIYNKNLFKEVKRERIEYGKQMDLGQCI